MQRDVVRDFWEQGSCGTDAARSEKLSRAYFEEIEAHRYLVEPEIHAFAQFTRARGRRVLEVGVGAGTDFLQWTRAGAEAVGIDLTEEALANTRARLAVYGLPGTLLRADCERLPFPDASFDLVYSWGVIHHAPDPIRALDEIIRVTRPGGACKVMIYNRHSPAALRHWVSYGLRRGEGLTAAIRHVESPGTRAYTIEEVRKLLGARPLRDVRVESRPTYYDRPQDVEAPRARARSLAALALARLLGWHRAGWFLTIEGVRT